MAGKRQHYIPRLLQRGFLDDALQGAERTWLHRAGTEPSLVSIRDVGVREYFYSKLDADGVMTLDDLITSLESGIDADLKEFRSASVGPTVDPKAAARLTMHLTLRTAHVRSLFEKGAMQILDQVVSLASDLNRMRDLLGIDGAALTRTGSRVIDEAMKALPSGTLLPRRLAQRVMEFWIRESFEHFHEEAAPSIVRTLAELGDRLSDITREGHNKALMTADQSHWEDELSRLSWRTYAVSGAILPDCVALAQDAAGSITALVLREQHCMDAVILPIAHDRLLVGSSIGNLDISIESINHAGASSSDSFFVSRRAIDGEGLASLIGQRCAQVIDAAIDGALADVSTSKVSQKSKPSSERYMLEARSPKSFDFSLTCLDFADAKTVARLGRVLQVIIQELGRDMPLSRLDGITFAADYVGALERLDRGDPTLSIDASQPRSYGRAVAKCVRVLRSGERKEHLVFEAGVAMGLMADDEDSRSLALHLVVSMLAYVAHSALYEAQLEALPKGAVDVIVGRLHSGVSAAPGKYFTARASAFTDPMSGDRYATLVKDSLASAHESIGTARLSYRLDDNLDRLLDVALLHVSFVLDHAAEWLGHRDGLPSQDAFPGSSLLDDMENFDLQRWLELFGRDLRRLYESDEQFTSANIFALTRHVERLLWTVQIFPWPTEDGRLYVSVPMGDDERLLADRALARKL